MSYPLFSDAETGIYPHAASKYHARPKAKRGIAMLSSQGSNWQYISIDSDNGLASNRRQAFIWTNDG